MGTLVSVVVAIVLGVAVTRRWGDVAGVVTVVVAAVVLGYVLAPWIDTHTPAPVLPSTLDRAP